MQKNELEEKLAPEIEAMGFECVKCEVVGASRSPVIRLFIDKPGGVSIDDCSRVSRAIGLVLEEKDPFPGRYLLEVSSPGSNRPLTTSEHFVRFTGSEAKVQALVREGGREDAGESRMTYTGRIRSCIDDVITIETTDGDVSVGLDRIISAQLVHQDYKIDKKMRKEKRSRRDRKRRGGSE